MTESLLDSSMPAKQGILERIHLIVFRPAQIRDLQIRWICSKNASFEYLGAERCHTDIYSVLSTYSPKESEHSCELFRYWLCPNTWLPNKKKLEEFWLKFGKVGKTFAKLGLKRKSYAAVSLRVIFHSSCIKLPFFTEQVLTKQKQHRALRTSVSYHFVNMLESFCLQEKKKESFPGELKLVKKNKKH